MIDSSKKQPGFTEIIPAGDFDPLKDKECLDPNNQKSLKEVLQLRLQQRRTREQLVDQGIMPPLKSPAAFHEQIKSLERARTENFLKHKIRSRPERSELVRMHILEETHAEPSLQATQMKLKRARLADDLNEKIAQRPGPMELVEKNILPVDSSVKEAIIDYPENTDAFSFDEDSDAFSPEQPASQESQGSAASPGEIKLSESVSPSSNINIQCQALSSPLPEFFKPVPAVEFSTRSPARSPAPSVILKPGPTLVKQSQPKNANDKPRSKKSKEPKPRVKKLKYHQYIPPDQKGEKLEPEMDSNYARLLQQQQLFLQLQILSQQQQHYNYQTILPAPLKTLNDKANNGNSITSNVNTSASSAINTTNRQNSIPFKKAGPLPSNLDDMKVAELKMELKLRGLPVSGTKIDLIERLKPYQDLNNNGVSANSATTTAPTATTTPPSTCAADDATMAFTSAAVTISAPCLSSDVSCLSNGSAQTTLDGINSPLPMSPAPSEQSNFSTEDSTMTDTFAEIMTMVSPSQFMNTSPMKINVNEDSMGSVSATNMDSDAAEKDRKLQEKEKQIEELKRKLEQEQKLVEVLKMQLEVEKRGQQQPCPNVLVNVEQKHFNAKVKEESMSDCQNSTPTVLSGHLIGQPTVTAGGQSIIANNTVVIKHELPLANPEHQNIIQQFYVTSQRTPQAAVVAQPQALITTPTAQILLPVSIKTTNAMQLSMVPAPPQAPSTSQPSVLNSTPATLVQVPSSQKPPVSVAQETFTAHLLNQNPQPRKVCPPATSNNIFSYQPKPVTTVPPSFNNNVLTTSQAARTPQAAPVQNGPTSIHESNATSPSQQYIVQHSVFNSSASKNKDPPRYEEAIKQARNIQPQSHTEVLNAHSQQMDDLFDILIKSGEISPLIKEQPSPISKMRPVTANVTTMPVNTVVSRPPPQIHVAPPLCLEPTSNLSISLESQLEAFLDGTLPSGTNIPHLESHSDGRDTFSLIDDLNNDLHSILDHDPTPMETTDTPFTASSCLSLDLQDANLDNMEWLDITSSASSLTPLSSTIPSMFSTDFLDTNDLQLQWE
ncbi:myocardin-related transcription factor B isoform 2-T2 [Anomaloglossus baeobatrachus]|uniref:myocardin-related transcription factor B isoform X2 n=1 Tax=Anomaloglossus baeobatrachus TaxID=238106 RepID=UPI003F4FE58C